MNPLIQILKFQECHHMISAIEISKTYHNSRTAALKNTNIVIDDGSINVIMGKSGSGKSTLLNILSGLIKPSTGTVYMMNKDYYRLSEKEKAQFRGKYFGYVFQSFQLIYELTVYDNIIMPLHITNQKVNEQAVYQLLKDLEIHHYMRSFPSELSGGQQQRVAIARAMIHNPKVIFADEPTGNLDSENSLRVIELLTRLCKKNQTTLLVVTHDKHLIKNPDHLFILKDGKLV